MERNVARWQELADDAGVQFRVHVKTHKVPAIALMQLAAGACGVVCAKVGEAEVFVEGGCEDIVIAYPVFGEEKWRRLAELARRARIGVNVDSVEAIEGISSAASTAGVTIELYLDVDTGMHRGGVDLRSIDELVTLCASIDEAPGVELAGVTTHRQLAYAAPAIVRPVRPDAMRRRRS